MENTKQRRVSTAIHIAFLAATALTLSACGESADQQAVREANTADHAVVYTYKDVQPCIEHEKLSPDACAKAGRLSSEAYERSAPRFGSAEKCSKVSPDCEAKEETKEEAKEKDGDTNQQHRAAGGGDSGYVHSQGTYYRPQQKGFTVVEPTPGSNEPPRVMPVYRGLDGLSTPSGVTGLKTTEVMTIPRSAVTTPSSSSATSISARPLSSSLAARPVISARGGFGGAGRAVGLSAGG